MAENSWIQSLLDRHGIRYEILTHANAYTAQQLAHGEHIKGRRVAKVVIVYGGGRALMLVLPATHRVSIGRVKELLGEEDVHLASENDMRRLFPDCEVGAEPPLPHAKPIPMWMDPSLRSPQSIVFPAGNHREAIRIPFEAWFNLARPRVESFAIEPGKLPPKPAEAF